MLNLLALSFWLNAGLDHLHYLDACFVQEPSFACFGADVLSKDEVGDDVGDESAERSIL
jgi:hypothetical protein